MKDYKFNRWFYSLARIHCGYCPRCGINWIQKTKYKVQACHIYRTSERSFTLRCKNCGLKWTITWKSLAQALETAYKDSEHKKIADSHVKHLRKYFDIKKGKSPRVQK